MNEEHRQELKRLAELSANDIGDNENKVKYNFIIPFLESFGYSKKQLDFEHSAQGNRIDILIDKVSNHNILIEAKSYGKNLDNYIPQLSEDPTIERIEAILGKQFLEDSSIVEHIEWREKEIDNIKKEMQSLDSLYQEKITKIDVVINNLEEQIKSLQSEIGLKKNEVADLKMEKNQEIGELRKQHLVQISQPKRDPTTVIVEPIKINRNIEKIAGNKPFYKETYKKQLNNPNSLSSKIFKYLQEHKSIRYVDLEKMIVQDWGYKKSGSIGASIIAVRDNNPVEDIGRGNDRIIKLKEI